MGTKSQGFRVVGNIGDPFQAQETGAAFESVVKPKEFVDFSLSGLMPSLMACWISSKVGSIWSVARHLRREG